MGYQDISRRLSVHFQQESFGVGVSADAGFKGAAEVIRVHSMQYSAARIEILTKREEHCLILRFQMTNYHVLFLLILLWAYNILPSIP